MLRLLKSWFWSGIREGENWAQTLVRVLGNLFRICLTIILSLVLILGGVVYVGHLRSEAQRAKKEKIQVVVHHREHAPPRLKDGKQPCSDEYPLLVIVKNSSESALLKMEIELVGRTCGQSTNELNYGESRITWDVVVLPHNFSMNCYSLPSETPKNELVYSGSAVSYTVKLAKVEPWMLEESYSAPLWKLEQWEKTGSAK